MAQFADIFAVPSSELPNLQPDYEALRETFPWLGVEGFSGLLFAIAANILGFSISAPGDPLAYDEEGGLAIFMWSPEFVSWLRSADPLQVRDLAKSLLSDGSYAHESADQIASTLDRLTAFARKLPPDSVIVEYATF